MTRSTIQAPRTCALASRMPSSTTWAAKSPAWPRCWQGQGQGSSTDKGLFKGNNKCKLPPRPPAPAGLQDNIDKGLFKGKHTGIGKGGSQNLYLQPGKGLFKGVFKGGMQNPYSTPQQHHEQLAALYGNGTGKAGKAGTGEEIKGKHMGKAGKGKRSRSPWRVNE
jgi:hypothetical protein